MIKEKKYNLLTIGGTVLFALVIYLVDLFWTIPAPKYNYPLGVSAPEYVYIILIGFLASLLLFLLFDSKIFVSWIKHIAWWTVPLAWWLVPGGSTSFFFDEMNVAGILMSILFIITLIYAITATFVQKRKEKEISQ